MFAIDLDAIQFILHFLYIIIQNSLFGKLTLYSIMIQKR